MKKIDMQPLAKEIEQLIQRRLNLSDRPAIVLAITIPPDYDHTYYVSNAERPQGLAMLKESLTKLIAQMN